MSSLVPAAYGILPKGQQRFASPQCVPEQMSAAKRAWDQEWFRQKIYAYILPPCDSDPFYDDCRCLMGRTHFGMLKAHGTLGCLHTCRRFRSEMEKVLFANTWIRLMYDDYDTMCWVEMTLVVQKIQKLDIQLLAVETKRDMVWMRWGLDRLCRGMKSLKEVKIRFVDDEEWDQPAEWWDESGPKITLDGCPSDLELALQPFERFRSLKRAEIHLPKYRAAQSSFEWYLRSVMAGNNPREKAEIELYAAEVNDYDRPRLEIEDYARRLEWEMMRPEPLNKYEWEFYKTRSSGITEVAKQAARDVDFWDLGDTAA